MKKDIQILLVDDHQVVRDGLQRMLEQEDDLRIVGQSSNAEETLARIDELSPDIVLMDIKMPGTDGIELTRQVKRRLPSCNVIMLTLYDQYLPQAMDAGARGYLLKDIKRRELAQAIRQVYFGQMVISESIRASTQAAYENVNPRPQISYENRYSPKWVDSFGAPVEDVQVVLPPSSGVQRLPKSADNANATTQGQSQAVKQVHHEQILTSEVTKTTTQVAYQDVYRQVQESSLTPVDELLVVLPPPVEASQLMKLADRIEEVFHSRVLQMMGSWQEGTVMTVVLPQSTPLADIIATFRNMPDIEGAGDQPTTQTVSPALLSKAESTPKLNNRNRKTIYLSFGKARSV